MTTVPPTVAAAPASAPTESLTFADVLRVVYRYRRLLALGTIAGLLLGVAYVTMIGSLYRSEGVFNLRYISFAEFKRYSPALADRDRFLDYATRSKQFTDAELATIRGAISRREALNAWVHPLFAVTKADVKDVAETPKDAGQFTGVEISVNMNSRDLARKLVAVCGEYVRDFVMEGKIYDLVLPGLATAVSDRTKKQIDILRSRFDLERLKQRRSELLSIAERYRKEERETQQRQVISIQDGGERYLSPVTQAIGIEAQITEANSDIAALERDVTRLNLLIDFYGDARKRLESAVTGQHMAAMEAAFEAINKRSDVGTEAARDALGTIRGDLDQLRAYNADYLRAAGAPSSQSQIGSITVWAPMLLATLAAFLFTLLVALMLAWWKRYGSSITSAPA